MAKIRDDFVGVIHLPEQGTYLKAGDTVPKGVTIGDHALADGKDSAPANTSQSDTGWGVKTVDELKAEVATRNEGRDEADHIEVGGKGNKPDLVAALEADDAKLAAAGY